MLVFTDRVLEALYEHIGRHEPERGGALLHFPWTNWIVAYVPDPDGAVTNASYVPSAAITDRVQSLERESGCRFAGVVHSHPGAYDQPSEPDRRAFRAGLDLNPHLAAFVAPIITRDRSADDAVRGEQALGEGVRMNTFLAYRTEEAPLPTEPERARRGNLFQRIKLPFNAGRRPVSRPPAEPPMPTPPVSRRTVRLSRTEIHVMPLGAHVRAAAAGLSELVGHPVEVRSGRNLQIAGAWRMTEDLAFPGGSLTLLFTAAYPSTPPAALLHQEQTPSTAASTEQLHLEWPLAGDEGEEMLWRRLEPHLQHLGRRA